jgi:5-histidylcysteine sulfoxide synthase
MMDASLLLNDRIMNSSRHLPQLNKCDRPDILAYFDRAWQLEDHLWQSLVGDAPFYLNPDPLRNLLIFYLGHSAVFYINKLIKVGLLSKRLNPDYEVMFEIGVDPERPDEIADKFAQLRAVDVASVWQYRREMYATIVDLIQHTDLTLPITPKHPLWALMMAIEHQYVHIETSSMLIRQLPVEMLHRPAHWQYAPANGYTRENHRITVPAGIVHLGKPQDSTTYGWDIDYGDRTVSVNAFLASQYLVTNADFLEFVKTGGYDNPTYWQTAAWQWRIQHNINYPKFWLPDDLSQAIYKYRALFDEIDMPFDYPVEVNYYEAIAYCQWYADRTGQPTRLMNEAEWHHVAHGLHPQAQTVSDCNLNLQFGSPNSVGDLETAKNQVGIYDLRGNVWEWLSSHLTPLSGYEPHYLYENYSAPYFDTKHYMMAGGSWMTCGTGALPYYRNWFRPNFYQHAGFRIIQDLGE